MVAMRGFEMRRPRGRAEGFTGLEAAILVMAAILLFAAAASPALRPAADVRTTTVRVESSQTLWEIAREHPLEDAGISETVTMIRSLNDLGSSDIIAGQVLVVPQGEVPALAAR